MDIKTSLSAVYMGCFELAIDPGLERQSLLLSIGNSATTPRRNPQKGIRAVFYMRCESPFP